MATNTEVELGDHVKDHVTGFEGIAIAITDWLYGCKRVTIQPRGLTSNDSKYEQGKPLEPQTFDIAGVQLLTKAAVPTAHRKAAKSTGGPRRDPQRVGHNLTAKEGR